MLRDHCIFWWQKKREDLVYYNMSRILPIRENYLVVFVNPGICPRIYYGISSKICLEICLEIHHAKKYLKNNGLPKFASGPPLWGRPNENSKRPWNLVRSLPCKTPCRLFIHEVFFGPLGLHLRVWSELGRSPTFWPMRALRLQWSWAFSHVCEVALKYENSWMIYDITCNDSNKNKHVVLCQYIIKNMYQFS